MKKIIILLLAITITACSKQDPIGNQIKYNIQTNAMGEDIGYTPKETTKILEVNYQNIKDVLDTEMKHGFSDLDKLIKQCESVLISYKESNNIEAYNYMKFVVSRFKGYQNAQDPKETVYTIYEHKYSINNPMLDGLKVDITNYYFFDGSGSLTFKVSDDDFNQAKRENIQHEHSPYEVLSYQNITF